MYFLILASDRPNMLEKRLAHRSASTKSERALWILDAIASIAATRGCSHPRHSSASTAARWISRNASR